MSTSNKQAYQQKLQAQLDEWSAEIDRLKAKARQADANAQLNYNKEIENLKTYQAQASEKLSELKAASDEAWEDLKTGTEDAWKTLQTAIKSAADRF